MARLQDLATVIRSKNSGPFELTLDIIFKDKETYKQVIGAKVITPEMIAGLYQISIDKIIAFVEFDPANAIKITMARPMPAGNPGDNDVYGAQQHGPLLGINLPF
jgi:hypothetical protein